MAIETPPTIAPPPENPSSDDIDHFDPEADAFLAWIVLFYSYLVALATNVFNNATEAFNNAGISQTAASNAQASASIALSSSGAAVWVSGTTYAKAAAARSPLNQRIYIRLIAGAGTTDPSADGTNWQGVNNDLTVAEVIGTTQAAVSGTHYTLTNVAATTVTLPASPQSGDQVWITVANALITNSIARNGKTIMGLSEDFLIDSPYETVKLRYVNTSWRII